MPGESGLSLNGLDCMGLMEIDMKGPKFTLRGPIIQNYERIHEKLDMVVCNTE